MEKTLTPDLHAQNRGFDKKTKHKLTIRCVLSILAFHHAE